MSKRSGAGTSLRVILLFIAVAAGALFILRPSYFFNTRYYTKAVPYSIYVAAHTQQMGDGDSGAGGGREQLLMLVNYGQVGWQGNRLEAFYVPLGETLGFFTDFPSPLKSRQELIRFADADGDVRQQTGQLDLSRVRIERRDASALVAAGTLMAQGEELYYIGYDQADLAGDDQGEEETEEETEKETKEDASLARYGWRWDGDAFVSIATEEVAKIWKDYNRDSARRAQRRQAASGAQGDNSSSGSSSSWQVCPMSTFSIAGLGRNNCVVNLSGEQWHFEPREANTPPNFEEIYRAEIPFTLRARSASGNVSATLIDDSGKWVEVSAEEYAAQQDARMAGFGGGQYGGRQFTPATGLRLLLPLFIFFGVYYGLIRKALNGSISPSRYYPEARPEDFPALDHERLAQYTADLEARGFVRLRDVTVVSPEGTTPQPPTFVRLFAHAELKCYAEVGQVFTDKPHYDSVIRMNISLLSHFAELGWTLGTSDRPAAPVIYVFRKPRALWQYRPGLSLDQLLSAHADVCRQMSITLALSPATDYTAETYFKLSEAAINETRELIKRRTRFGLLPLLFEIARSKSEQHYQWLGDYGLYPSPSGWTPPGALPQTDDEPYRQPAWRRLATANGWQQLVLNWSDLISVFSTVCIGMMVYFWFVLPAPQQPGTRLWRLGLTLAGLLGQFVVWLAKRGSSGHR